MKRDLIRSVLNITGATAMRLHALPRRLYCFNYHRIGNPSDTEFDRGVFSCSAAHFRQHVEFFCEEFDVLNLEQVRWLKHEDARRIGKKPLALITFDDGYIDNFEVAFPILRRCGASAVFFLPTAFIGGNLIPWWDEIAWLLRHSTASTLVLQGLERGLLAGPKISDEAIRRVFRLVKSRTHMRMSEQLAEVRSACACSTLTPVSRLFMSWGEARALRDGGCDLASHTHTHDILSHLTLQQQRLELEMSREILSGHIGSRVEAIAYPVGSRSSFTSETTQIARELGYELGFNFIPFSNRVPLEDPLSIGRYAVDGDMSAARLRTFVAFPSV